MDQWGEERIPVWTGRSVQSGAYRVMGVETRRHWHPQAQTSVPSLSSTLPLSGVIRDLLLHENFLQHSTPSPCPSDILLWVCHKPKEHYSWRACWLAFSWLFLQAGKLLCPLSASWVFYSLPGQAPKRRLYVTYFPRTFLMLRILPPSGNMCHLLVVFLMPNSDRPIEFSILTSNSKSTKCQFM